MTTGHDTVLILGAGINGCALARELTLNGLSVWLVDTADIASGATAGSSHLIHGGLRYLEYGDFELVKESLAERGRLLRLAPQFVRPLRLWIPSVDRFGGMMSAVGRFWGWKRWSDVRSKNGRGSWLVRAGLAFYDTYARDPLVPRHRVMRVNSAGAPQVDPNRYHWISSYYDAQVIYPERLTMALVEDARRHAEQRQLDFRVFTYHRAVLRGTSVEIVPTDYAGATPGPCVIEPAMIVNATGAWVDETLQRLQVPSGRLMGGTKGSHLFTFHARLRELLGDDGIYAEAPDGRPIFITPLGEAVLIGTTDERFEGPPEQARATDGEIEYLLAAVNEILPAAGLTRADIDFHYSAVRPLPHANAATTAAISRRHAVVKHEGTPVPMISLVGGKLTTMRSLAETAADVVLTQLGRPVAENSRESFLPGGADDKYPAPDALAKTWEEIAARTGYPAASVAAAWQLCGALAACILEAPPKDGHPPDKSLLDDTPLPYAMVRWSIEHEHARTLADLVERRLMLLYHQRLTRATLRGLGQALAEAGHLGVSEIGAAVETEIARLLEHYGRLVS
jgi:glycerol-3-phosphate dehydrogenase